MKKNLLIAAMVLPFLSVSAQWNQVGGTVSVKPGTLKYVEQTYDVTQGSTSNEGNVNVRGTFNVETAGSFTNEWNGARNYGQLIINDTSTATGKVIGEFKNTDNATFYNHVLAVPFTGVTAQKLAEDAGIITIEWVDHPRNSVFNNQRWRNAVNTWENAVYALAGLKANDVITTGSATLSPANYYSFNQQLDNLGQRLSGYEGIPANVQHSLVLTPYTIVPGSEAVVNSYSRNVFGEMLGTYLKDGFVAAPTGWALQGRKVKPTGFGENLYYFGNPYTSNVDLNDVLPTDGSITGVQQFSGNSFDPNSDSNGNSNLVAGTPTVATWDGSGWVGNTEVLLLRPFHTFALKTNGSAQTIVLNEGIKTFNIDASAPAYVDRNTNTVSNQLKIELFKNDALTSRAFVVASPIFQPTEELGNEAYIDVSNDVDVIYTLQENADGGVRAELAHAKTYINGINQFDYVGLPVYLVHQVAEAGDFVLKGILSSAFLNGNNSFYFEDIQENFISEITADFEYAFSATETSTDRFRIYWNGLPVTLSTGDIAIKDQTRVYQDNREFKVRFADSWSQADIYVYNMMGQLVHTAKKVNTQQDYLIPLKGGAAAYVVKAVNENGEIATQKIIKK
ncbi:MAG: T9SS type A sorting domain-containing protein [Flavobacteriaceae bacterium]|nr:T9SS type A sorting domain-containing protein [Flavobacteriaceae bacterium]